MSKCKEKWNIQVTLGIWCTRASFKIPATFIDSIRPNKYPENETKNQEMRFNFQQIALSSLGLRTQKLGLGKVDLEPSPNRGSYKINMLKWGRKTAEENKSYHTAKTHTWISALREVDLEPSAKRGANGTEDLVSLYWSPQSLHPKELPNRISHTKW